MASFCSKIKSLIYSWSQKALHYYGWLLYTNCNHINTSDHKSSVLQYHSNAMSLNNFKIANKMGMVPIAQVFITFLAEWTLVNIMLAHPFN